MSQYIGVRAFNRSQAVRIGGQKVRSVISRSDSDATSSNVGSLAPITYIDLENTTARKELAYHAAIGAVYTCTPVQSHPYPAVVTTSGGLVVSQGSNASDMILATAAGTILANTGDYFTKSATTADVTIPTAPGAGFKRVDLVSLKVSDQTLLVTSGTAVTNATTLPNTLASTAAVPAGHIPLATVAVASSVTAIGDAAIADARPRGWA